MNQLNELRSWPSGFVKQLTKVAMLTQEIPPNVEVKACRVCGNANMRPLFSFGNLYVNNFVSEQVYQSGYAGCPRCPLDVEQCPNCTLVQLRHSAPQELLYSRKYWYRSGVTQTMKDGLKDVAECAFKNVTIEKGDVVLDIGSNDGTLLRQFERLNLMDFVLVGVEPADNLATQENYKDLLICHDFWSFDAYEAWWENEHEDGNDPRTEGIDAPKAKIICALGMFYDLEQPIKFIQDIAKILHPEGVFIAQLMCLRQTVEQLDVGNFCHEHLQYYTLKSLKFMFDTCDLEIYDIGENNINGGSYRLYIKHKACTSGLNISEGAESRVRTAFAIEEQLHNPHYLFEMYHKMLKNAQALQQFIRGRVHRRYKCFVYGASTKGNTILQFAGIDNSIIEGAGDKDPNKNGLRTIGTGIPIMSIEAMRQFYPDYALVLPYAFESEIVAIEKSQRWRTIGGKFVIPIPTMRVI